MFQTPELNDNVYMSSETNVFLERSYSPPVYRNFPTTVFKQITRSLIVSTFHINKDLLWSMLARCAEDDWFGMIKYFVQQNLTFRYNEHRVLLCHP